MEDVDIRRGQCNLPPFNHPVLLLLVSVAVMIDAKNDRLGRVGSRDDDLKSRRKTRVLFRASREKEIAPLFLTFLRCYLL